ncbi:hypothetical protein [Sediminibacillus massiliensis]|uniref:hypothetical protein n=1 Tax=Sediminibacillus massiliensis TaxID=1926277 RepID=UPI0009884FFD|nr:hypothetical protein [Sediminibacillus massiliensis]
MSERITPNWIDLVDKSDDELRDILSELNSPSLRKLTREAIHALEDYRDYVQHEKEEKQWLYGKLNQIGNIIERGRKEIPNSNLSHRTDH